jgi:hypothetical protein
MAVPKRAQTEVAQNETAARRITINSSNVVLWVVEARNAENKVNA